MIIQCRQCRTKFYFDDAMMQGDGMWMRCSRCQHVFFQDNPLIIKPEIEIPLVPESVFSEEPMPAKRSTDLTKEVPPVSDRDEDVVRFLDNVMEAKKTVNDKVNLEIEKTRRENSGKENFMSAERSAAFRDLKEKVEDFEQKSRYPEKVHGKHGRLLYGLF